MAAAIAHRGHMGHFLRAPDRRFRFGRAQATWYRNMTKTFLRNLLLAYKPLDARLRHIGPYARLSRVLQTRYNAMMSGEGAASAKALDARAYIDNFERVAPRTDTILFECYWGKKFADNPLAMYRALLRNQPQGRFRIIWVAKEGESAPDEIARNPDVRLVRAGTAEYGMALLEAGYLVNNVTFPTWFIRRPGQHYCNTWHGVPMKAMGRDMVAPLVSKANSQRNFLQADVIPELSEYYRWATIRPCYADELLADALFPCGAPRVDDVIVPKVPARQLRDRYGIGADQQIVLFAPTWRGNSTQISQVFGDQAKLCREMAEALGQGYFVLFSAHQMLRVRQTDLAPNMALLAENDNINDILTIVDVMVSDYSSILFDFLPVDRPIVLFTPDIDHYREDRGLYLEPADLPCANTTDFAGLVGAIRAARRPSDFPGYEQMRQRFTPFEDGHAAETALAALLDPATKASHRRPDGRLRLLIEPGGMLPNGITASLRSLIANLDYERFDPYILIDATAMDNEPGRMQQFQEFDPRCNWIWRYGDMLRTSEEQSVYQSFCIGDTLNANRDLPILRRIFEREARRVLGSAHFDIAIEFGGYSPYWTSLIACSNAVRKVCYQHSHLWAEYNNLMKAHRQLNAVFQIYRWFDQIIAVSDETRTVNETHLKQFYPAARARTVRNTLDVKRVLEKARLPVSLAHPEAGMLFQDPGLFRFVALGRLSPEKRYDRMIGALARIAPEHPNAVLMICGEGSLRDKLVQLARRKGVAEQVRFLGQVSNPYPLLAHADVCMLSSDYEGQPMVLLEALCLGATCIGSDIPGVRSVLKDGLGHIVAPTEEAFAEAMKAAIEGRLPALKPADIGGPYIEETMREFTEIVCGLAGSSAAAPGQAKLVMPA
ncbi:CDP-glycerol glycerophosphotransferase, TagB/SpsB family [Paracoccus aminovorans]|uniref:CDP-glycerol glycerophosphotransferase, TagB/SpsB family n=1 Tax=Paracoccus aminovorans TaxID=34004 RepID=A0A1I2XVQ0_9RHOB|nr:glycosyltransferase [Paracoccus aminovorans]SFH16191.1 CDP-glycerol glycerophosphotransferase, TagB/SpsB family [Paracoccus aminovorans]